MSANAPRSVKIGEDERGGWTSDRPRRPGEAERPPREPDISVRGRVLAPSDRLRYSPGSLLLVACADHGAQNRFLGRVLEEQGALLSMDKVRGLLKGKVPEDAIEAKSQELLDAAVNKRLSAGQSVVVALDSLDVAESKRYVMAAYRNKRPRHMILLEVPKAQVADEDAAALQELRTTLDAGELGAEGYATSLRLGGRSVEELNRIVFRPPPAED
ncbi:MAG: hypothetical protein JWP17_763 [Solirubrobacterales bacterium]|jgi:hypothetical protein|nr:hypothetical protein [Solirubrobacterales bacterium]